ncbi:polysaccharide deacetylase family protein [Neobacillus sp. GCM10023253]|uniref:polysaccharide deacetylase family protein n=1 Tax=Neobacillus sp. GCM10023253 TaxID=3252644 RepID=UPI00360A1764
MKKGLFIPTVFLYVFIIALGSLVEPLNVTAVTLKTDIQAKQKKNDDLYKKIEAFSNEHRIAPIDATIDRIWKAIPGHNGLDADIKASYKKMKKSGKFDKNKIVFKEVSPRVHLEDLAAEPIYRGNPQKPMVALLINVAWGNEYIPTILEVLNDSKVKATFFYDGSWVKKNPDLARMIYKEGHEIGNHAYSHPDLQRRSKSETIQEISKTNTVIEETIGVKPKWFAPPSGSFNKVTIQVADELNMKTILWTIDTVDWRKPATGEMVNRIVKNADNGFMVLMHPTKPVVEGLGDMITGIKAKGIQLGTVSDLLSEKRINQTR